MPNWVDQEFVVAGPREDIGRFCALAVTGDVSLGNVFDDDGPTFPIPKAEARACQDEHRPATLLQIVRSRTEAQLSCTRLGPIQSTFYYTTRLLRDQRGHGKLPGILARIGWTVIDHVESAVAPDLATRPDADRDPFLKEVLKARLSNRRN